MKGFYIEIRKLMRVREDLNITCSVDHLDTFSRWSNVSQKVLE